MAIIYSYPHATPTINDMVLGAKFKENEGISTNSFYISDLVTIISEEIVIPPYTVPTLQDVTSEGGNTIVQMQINGVDVATVDNIPTPAYKVCSVLLTGNADNSLTVVELQNTIGIINWNLLAGVSLQMDTGNNNFTTGKTAVFFSNNPTGKSLSATVYTNQNNIQVGVSDGYTTFNNTFVEIRVYN